MHPASHFAALGLSEPLLKALAAEKYLTPTPIQAKTIPTALAGRDVLGSAQTGTGKTAAFALPILQRLSQPRPAGSTGPRCLVLSPTRELAVQIGQSFRTYGKFLSIRQTVIFGGVGQNPQVDALRRGAEIVIATPGRLMDLMEQRLCDLRGIEILVLDEADRMLDMGFIRDVKKIVAAIPGKRQTLLFSATMPSEVRSLANTLLSKPEVAEAARVATPASGVDQSVYHVERRNKPALLAHLVRSLPMSRAIVFTRTKRGADKLVQHLHKSGLRAEAIHSNKSQNARQRALDAFRADKVGLLIATDIASRGIDIDDITHVVNYDLTHEPETYVHRIGRTARAGATGSAIAFCDPEEMPNLKAIEKLLSRKIPVRNDQPVFAAGDRQDGSRDRRKPAHAPSRQSSSNDRPRSHAPAGQHRHNTGPSGHPRSHAPATSHQRSESQAKHPRSQSQSTSHPRSHAPSARPASQAPAGRPASHAPRPAHNATRPGGRHPLRRAR